MKFASISIAEPNDKFHTFISRFFRTISRICFNIANELNLPAVATPKWRTLKLPQLSCKFGLNDGPSTIIDVTAVPVSYTHLFFLRFSNNTLFHFLIICIKKDRLNVGLKRMGRGGFEPPKQFAADLQSVPFGHSGICPFPSECEAP